MKENKVGCVSGSSETETHALAWDEGEDFYERLFESGKAGWLGSAKHGAGRWNQNAGEIVRDSVVHPDPDGDRLNYGLNYIALESPLSSDVCAFIDPCYTENDIIATVLVQPRKAIS